MSSESLLSRKICRSRARKQRGVTMVEMALALPIVLMVFYGIVEFGRFLSVRSLTQAAALKGLALATTIDGITEDPGSQRYQAAKQRVVALVRTELLKGMISDTNKPGGASLASEPVITVPQAANAIAGEQTLAQQPMAVSVTIKFKPLLRFLPARDVLISVNGFREPRQIPSMPIPLDCQGDLYGSPNYQPEHDCRCAGENQVFNQTSGLCGCRSPFQEVRDNSGSLSCVCPSGVNCAPCPLNQDVCGEGATFDKNSCQCLCPKGQVPSPSGGCVVECTPPKVASGQSCVCPACPLGMSRNDETCECKCWNGKTNDQKNACICTGFDFPADFYSIGTWGCECTKDSACTEGKTMSGYGNACRCDCPGNQAVYNGKCGCAPGWELLDNGWCKCTKSCPDGQARDGDACQCCPGDKPHYNSATGQCQACDGDWDTKSNTCHTQCDRQLEWWDSGEKVCKPLCSGGQVPAISPFSGKQECIPSCTGVMHYDWVTKNCVSGCPCGMVANGKECKQKSCSRSDKVCYFDPSACGCTCLEAPKG